MPTLCSEVNNSTSRRNQPRTISTGFAASGERGTRRHWQWPRTAFAYRCKDHTLVTVFVIKSNPSIENAGGSTMSTSMYCDLLIYPKYWQKGPWNINRDLESQKGPYRDRSLKLLLNLGNCSPFLICFDQSNQTKFAKSVNQAELNQEIWSLFNESDWRVGKGRILRSAFIILIRVLPQLNNIRLAVTGGPLLLLKQNAKFNFQSCFSKENIQHYRLYQWEEEKDDKPGREEKTAIWDSKRRDLFKTNCDDNTNDKITEKTGFAKTWQCADIKTAK